MSAEIYVKEVEKSPESGTANERIDEGDFVTALYGGGVKACDPGADDVVDGIVPHRMRGPHLPEHEEDYSEAYYEDGAYPVPYYSLEDGMDVMPHTVIDEAAPEPTVNRHSVVGVIQMDGSQYGSGHPVLVEEGYSADPDGTGTVTFNRANDNFHAIGLAKEHVSDHGVQVHAQVQSQLLASR